MRIHTTSVPATKYMPIRIHVKFTDDMNVPDNITDKTYTLSTHDESDHDFAVGCFLIANNMSGRDIKKVGTTSIKRGWIYQILENE